MTQLVWDKPSDRVYSTGLDRGIIFTRDGEAHVWNGLQKVVEKTARSATPIYFDGVKSYDQVTVSAYSATISAITYPDILEQLTGKYEYRPGFYLADQSTVPFSLCYRTLKRNALGGESHVIHILYDVSAYPSDVTHESLSDGVNLQPFSWDVTTQPTRIEGARSSGYFEFDSSRIDPIMFQQLMDSIYGTDETDPKLPSIPEIVAFYDSFYRVIITDNMDGTFTITIPNEEDAGLLVQDPDDPTKYTVDMVTVLSETSDEWTIDDTKIELLGG